MNAVSQFGGVRVRNTTDREFAKYMGLKVVRQTTCPGCHLDKTVS